MNSVKVWDLPVRLCHWGLAACVAANLAVTEEGSPLHRYIGYTAAGIVLFRLLWGLIGSRHARFRDFFPTPARVQNHLRQLKQGRAAPHAGHNPLGALMMLALWATVIGLGCTGWLMGTDAFFGSEIMEELHGFLADLLIPLIALHVAAAFIMSRLEQSGLIRAMFTGRKNLPDTVSAPTEITDNHP